MRALLRSVAFSAVLAPLLTAPISDAGDIGARQVRSVVFDSGEDKARWLDAMATLDARLPLVRDVARRFAMSSAHDPNNTEALARDFHRFVRDAIRYVKDPAAEEMSDSEIILRQGYGDCDDKSRLFVALCRTVQIPARIRPCFRNGEFVHVQAEVKENGRWVVVELIVRDLEMGKLPPKGKQVLS